MTQTSRKLVAGNWKMHGLSAALHEARAMAEALAREPPPCRVALFPPATLIHRMAEALKGSCIEVGGQDHHHHPHGAYTGDVCAEMLRDAGASLVILGHSERRAMHRESDDQVAAKVEAAVRAGLEPIVCVGETLDQRNVGEARAVVEAQVEGSVPEALAGRAFCMAYEPVWAVGAGVTPTLDQIAEMHTAIGKIIERRFPGEPPPPILYGGSVKPANAAEILHAAGVGGVLVGGASLTAAEFLPIVYAA